MQATDFVENVKRILPGVTDQALEIWVNDAKVDVDSENFAYFKDTASPEDGLSDWLDVLYSTFHIFKLKYGQELAERTVMLSVDSMCMWAWDLSGAIVALRDGKSLDGIREMYRDGTLEGNIEFPTRVDVFWALIERANALNGHDLDGAARWLQEQLEEAGPQAAFSYHEIIHGYELLSRKYGLWSAANIILGGCSDDSFDYFRDWLIYQGEKTFFAALESPDSLADIEPYGDCRFERLSYIGNYAYKKLTGTSAYDLPETYASIDKTNKELLQKIRYGKGIEYPYEWNELQAYLPRLCEKYCSEGELEERAQGDELWNHDIPKIRELRHEPPELLDAQDVHLSEVTVLGKKALYSAFRIDPDTVPKGLHLYEIRSTEAGWWGPCQIAKAVDCNFYGSIITSRPIVLDDDGIRHIDPDKDWKDTDKIGNLTEFFKAARFAKNRDEAR